MEVLSGPWADLALLLRQTLTLSHGEADSFLPLWLLGLLLFLSVCLLLLQLIVYFSWKLRQEHRCRFSCGSTFTICSCSEWMGKAAHSCQLNAFAEVNLSRLPEDISAIHRQTHGHQSLRTRGFGCHSYT
ncbi:uncharacterized protein ACNS7B_002319 isoform 1-T5 [Menidia menidia]